jgi:glycosyltransferase involved in cell wall biosynthesis
MPRFSIVIPVHNDAARLGRALDSVLRQTVQDFEVFVVDDCSTDDPEAVVRRRGDPRVRCVRNPENFGPGGTRNRGLALARAPLLKALDSDDWIEPTFLERVEAIFQAQPDVALVATSAVEHHEGTSPVEVLRRNLGPFGQPGPCDGRAFQEFYFAGGSAGNPSQAALRTDWAREAGGWGERMLNGDEGALWLRVVHRRHAWFLDEPLAHLTLHGASTTARASRRGLEVLHVARMFQDLLRDLPELDTPRNRARLVWTRGYHWFARGRKLLLRRQFADAFRCWSAIARFAPTLWWAPLFLARAGWSGCARLATAHAVAR